MILKDFQFLTDENIHQDVVSYLTQIDKKCKMNLCHRRNSR